MMHVVIGGGIAGVCCVEELCRLRPDDSVTLISSSTVLKVCSSTTKSPHSVYLLQFRLHSCQPGTCCALKQNSQAASHASCLMLLTNSLKCSVCVQGIDSVIRITKTIEEVSSAHGTQLPLRCSSGIPRKSLPPSLAATATGFLVHTLHPTSTPCRRSTNQHKQHHPSS
jgi:hypothetical protein